MGVFIAVNPKMASKVVLMLIHWSEIGVTFEHRSFSMLTVDTLFFLKSLFSLKAFLFEETAVWIALIFKFTKVTSAGSELNVSLLLF